MGFDLEQGHSNSMWLWAGPLGLHATLVTQA